LETFERLINFDKREAIKNYFYFPVLSAPIHNLKLVFINGAYKLRDTFFPEHAAFIYAVKMLYKVLNTTPDDSTRVIFM
jgi:hypothetical protein